MRHLFIGGNGLVGSAAVQLAQDLSLDWGATSRSTLNLNDIPKGLPETDVVYLIAAKRNPSECDDNPRQTWPINADAPVTLTKHYYRNNTFVVFVSSDNVQYGRGMYATQKRFVENSINMLDVAILRPGRITHETVRSFVRFMIDIGSARTVGVHLWNGNL